MNRGSFGKRPCHEFIGVTFVHPENQLPSLYSNLSYMVQGGVLYCTPVWNINGE